MAAEDVEDTDLEALRSAALATVKSKDKVEVEDDDDDLEALRQAALLSRKSTPTENHQKENLSPLQHFRHHPYLPKRRNFLPRLPRGAFLGPRKFLSRNPRSNLIVINTLPSEDDAINVKENKSEECAPVLLRPQDKWCRIADELSSSPKQVETRPKGPEKFNRCESSSDSEDESDDESINDSGSRLTESDQRWNSEASDSEDNLELHTEEMLSSTEGDTQFTANEETSEWDTRGETPVQDERPETRSSESAEDVQQGDLENSVSDRPASNVILLGDRCLSEEAAPPPLTSNDEEEEQDHLEEHHPKDDSGDVSPSVDYFETDTECEKRNSDGDAEDDFHQLVDSNCLQKHDDLSDVENGKTVTSEDGSSSSSSSSSPSSSKSPSPLPIYCVQNRNHDKEESEKSVKRQSYETKENRHLKEKDSSVSKRSDVSSSQNKEPVKKLSALKMSDLRHQLERKKQEEEKRFKRDRSASTRRRSRSPRSRGCQSRSRSPQLKSVLSVVKNPDYFKASDRRRRRVKDTDSSSISRHSSSPHRRLGKLPPSVRKDRSKDRPTRRVFLASNENEKMSHSLEDRCCHEAVNVTVPGATTVDDHLDGKLKKKQPVHLRLGQGKAPAAGHETTRSSSSKEDGIALASKKSRHKADRGGGGSSSSSHSKRLSHSKLTSFSVCIENKADANHHHHHHQELSSNHRNRFSDKRIKIELKRRHSGDEEEQVGRISKSSRKSHM